MIDVCAFQPEHLAMIDVQPSQRGWLLTGEQYAAAGPAWTAFTDDGRAILAAGMALMDPGYAHCWAVLATDKRSDMWPITRQVRRVIAGCGYRRIELFTDARVDAAARWAMALGFELEGVRRASMPDGGDMLVWAIVREEKHV